MAANNIVDPDSEDRSDSRAYWLNAEKIAKIPSGRPINEECVICYGSLKHFAVDKNGKIVADVVQLPKCKHVYHRSCMIPWLVKKGNCPYCRKGIY